MRVIENTLEVGLTNPSSWDYISNISIGEDLENLIDSVPTRTEIKPKRWWRAARTIETYRSNLKSSDLYNYAKACIALYEMLTGENPPTEERVKYTDRMMYRAGLTITGYRLVFDKEGYKPYGFMREYSDEALQAIRVLCCANWDSQEFHNHIKTFTDKVKNFAQVFLDELYYRGDFKKPRTADAHNFMTGYRSFGDYDAWFPNRLEWTDVVKLTPFNILPKFEVTYTHEVGSVEIPKLGELRGVYRPKLTPEVELLLKSLSKVDATSLENVQTYLEGLPKDYKVVVVDGSLVLSATNNVMIVPTSDNDVKVHMWLKKFGTEWTVESVNRFKRRVESLSGVVNEYLTCGSDLGFDDVVFIPVWSEEPSKLERSLYLRDLNG